MTRGANGEPALRVIETRTAETRVRFWGSLLLRIGFFVFLGYFLWRTHEILATLTISLILASVLDAMAEPLCRRAITFRFPFMKQGLVIPLPQWGNAHARRTAATGVAFLTLLAGIIGSLIFMVRPFQQEYQNLQTNWPEYQKKLNVSIAQVKDLYGTLPPGLRSMVDDKSAGSSTLPSPGELLMRVGKTAFSWVSHAFELLLIPILAFYLVVDGRRLRNEILFLVPPRRRRTSIALMRQATQIMRSYIVAQCLLAVIAGVVISILLASMGMKYPLILGLFAGFTRAIPVVGGFMGTVPVVVLAFGYGAQTNHPWLWVHIFLVISLINVVESKWLMPKLLGHHLDLHPVLIIVALLVGGEFFGLMGMFLAAPVAAFARVLIVNYFVRKRRNAVVLADAGTLSGDGDVLRLDRTLRFRKEPHHN